MPSRHLSQTSLRLAMRVCDRIQQQDGAQNPALPSSALFHVAYWTVRLALGDSPDPVSDAFLRIFGDPNPPPVPLTPMFPLLDPLELVMIDGRTPVQWFQSVIAYLEWRSGIEWRNGSQRDDSDRDPYLVARRLMRSKFYSPSSPAIPLHQLPPKKPPRSVRLAAAMKRSR